MSVKDLTKITSSQNFKALIYYEIENNASFESCSFKNQTIDFSIHPTQFNLCQHSVNGIFVKTWKENMYPVHVQYKNNNTCFLSKRQKVEIYMTIIL